VTLDADPVLVGLDVGGSYVKATAVHPARGVLATRGRPAVSRHPHPGHNERDAEATWRLVADTLAELVAALGSGTEIVAVGVTGHGNGLYLLDGDGRPTRDAIMASDTRAGDLVRVWRGAGLTEELRPVTWNGMWPGQPGSLLAWLAAYEPDALRRSEHAVLCSDYVRARLTGAVEVELTGLSCSGLFDNNVQAVSARVLDALGIAEHARLLAEPVASASLSGATLAEETGLPRGTPVVTGLVDNVALHLGAGVRDGRTLCVAAGTWSVNQLLTGRAAMDEVTRSADLAPFAACLAHLPDTALLIDASPTSASVLGWALDNAFSGLREEAAAAGRNPFEVALELAAASGWRAGSPFFLPYLDGTRDDPSARGAWVNLSSWNDRGALLAAVVEGVCMEHRRHLDRLDPGGTLPVRMTGGAARSRVWAQLFADVTGRRVEVSAQEEVGAVGVAMHAGVSLGLLRDWAETDAVLQRQRASYEPSERAALHQRRFESYQEHARRLAFY
jgi:L-xylulokinase